LFKRLGKKATPEGKETLDSIRLMVAELETNSALPDLSTFRAKAESARVAGQSGLSEALRCLDFFASDFQGEINGVKTFTDTRLNKALQSRPTLFERLKESESNRLLAQMREAKGIITDRASLGDPDGREQGELMKSRSEALKQSLVIGFKAEPGAVDESNHALWALTKALSISLDAQSVCTSIET
jgi:hypothetical protein